MPGPPPKPTVLKFKRGNPGHQKLNKNEPQPTIPAQLPEPPPFLSGYAKDEWWRLVGELCQLKLLTIADTMTFAAYCQSYARWRQAEEALMKMAERDPVTGALLIRSSVGDPRVNPLIRIADNAALGMVRYASEFGLSPAGARASRPALHGATATANSTASWPDKKSPIAGGQTGLQVIVAVETAPSIGRRSGGHNRESFPMRPIRLSDSELDAVMAAARPLPIACRDAFLQSVADALQRHAELGPGVVHRVCAEAQRAFFDPPDLSRSVGSSKYR